MEPWLIAIFFKPFFLLAFFVSVAAIALLLKPVFPVGPLKDLMFDRAFRLRHPLAFGTAAICLWVSFIISLAIASRNM